ncbi:Gfo/Idh/MocA family oxidoreductase [Bradyrhizobium sp. DASA03120]|uniref:Gfo/Idh/MocA family oxidoreductase n=1 Tax=Bradyrhizobium sp. SMVTL-02 TaxID=3395917 RepID=UPI003F71BB77
MSAVVVVTKRRATGPIVLDALNTGRHVQSEKPMACTIVQAASLVEAARRQRLIYSMGYVKRHDARVARALDLVNGSEGAWREDNFERGTLTIELRSFRRGRGTGRCRSRG